MSTHASTKIDQKEYLKKYLSGKKVKKKKKEKKHKSKDSGSGANVIIIDDDIGAHGNGPEIDEELLLAGDDAPQIVGEYTEEGPNTSSAVKWRSIAVKEEKLDEDELRAKVKIELEVDLWGRKDGKIKEEPDISPPRSRRAEGDSSPRRRNEYKRHSKSTEFKRRDKSPQRQSKHSAGKSRRENEVADQSPVRNRQESPARRRDKSKSPPRRRRKDSSDQSPPRHRDSDQSPARKRLPSPGRQRRRKDSLDQSPPRNRTSDRNPPSRRAQSPPRRHRRSSDQSPPRKRFSSNSPIRIKREKLTPDQSPPRPQKMRRTQESPPRHSRWEKRMPTNSPSPPPTHKPKSTKTLDGKKAGLQDAQAMKAETEERRRQEDRMFAKMSSDVSGRDAEVAVRSTGRRGRRARDAAAEDPEQQRRKEAQEKKKRELYERWGKGLKQIEDHRLRLAEQEHESSKPLARYSNDEDLDRHLREQERLDDPMLEYMRKKKTEREKEANVPTMPVYQGSFPENRFGIRPGYRWDGVDRSNGYEKKWFDVQNERCAVREEAYKYSVEDM